MASELLQDAEAAKKVVVDWLTKKSKSKTKFYIKDFYALFPDDKPREIKKVINKMVETEVLEFWSSGSTTMYGLKGAGIQHASEGEA
nr:dissimilatory sulfite reductase D family protein [uncultured Desulfobacter sp.]